MIGIAIGDYIGSSLEGKMYRREFKFKEIPAYFGKDPIPKYSRFTDDTVLAFALVEALLSDKPYYKCIKDWATYYPKAGYGKMFMSWMRSNKTSYSSYGNGAAVRAAIIGQIYAKESTEELEKKISLYTRQTHGHPYALKDALIVGKMAACFYNKSSDMEVSNEELVNELYGIIHEYYPTLVYKDEETNKWVEPSIEDSSNAAIFSARSYPSVLHSCQVAAQAPLFHPVYSINKGLWLNEDPDTQAAIVGSIFDNADLEALKKKGWQQPADIDYWEWADVENHVLEQFDNKMRYWYEKFTKEFNLK